MIRFFNQCLTILRDTHLFLFHLKLFSFIFRMQSVQILSHSKHLYVLAILESLLLIAGLVSYV